LDELAEASERSLIYNNKKQIFNFSGLTWCRIFRHTFNNCILLVDRYNNRRDLPRCNVARENKSKPEITRCGVASIFRWFSGHCGSSPLLFRYCCRQWWWWHMYTHTNHTRALIFDLQFEKNTSNEPRVLIFSADKSRHHNL